jgi:uncharacterized protein (TIGR00251 family)
MKLKVRVVPKAKQNKLVEEDGRLKVYVTAPPVEGKANKALIEYLMEHFKVKRRQITIVQGQKSRDKFVEIKTD